MNISKLLNKIFGTVISTVLILFAIAIMNVVLTPIDSNAASVGYSRAAAESVFAAPVRLGERHQKLLTAGTATSITLNSNTVGVIISVQSDVMINFWGTDVSTSDCLMLKAETGTYRFDGILFGAGTSGATKYLELEMVTPADSRTGTVTLSAAAATDTLTLSEAQGVQTFALTGAATTGTLTSVSRASHTVTGSPETTGWAAGTAPDTVTSTVVSLTVAAANITGDVVSGSQAITGTGTTAAHAITGTSYRGAQAMTGSIVTVDTSASTSYATIIELKMW